MKTNDIRRTFLDFFAARGHTVVPSSPLVPANDPTLLFTNAGMVQFKDVFLGRETRDYNRAASAQRCVRAGGKHNDLENVGYTARHHTFFEMLGNFSFGDYFKREAILYAWELLTDVYGLPAERLWATVYETDDEAYEVFANDVKLPRERIVRIGDKPDGREYESDNFWQMADTGPCGPCAEIFYDHGPEVAGGPPGSPEAEGDRYVEIWNLVFMQYDRASDGTMTSLPAPCVDTGMGIERIAAVLQGVHSNYDIDLFKHLIRAAAKATGVKDLQSSSLKVIADHIRASAFLIADGVNPSNEGRGYVLRRIMRRAIRHGYRIGRTKPFFYKLVAPLAEEMGDAYPELLKQCKQVEQIVFLEEERFAKTLNTGMTILERYLSREALVATLKKAYPSNPVEVIYSDSGLNLDAVVTTNTEKTGVKVLSEIPEKGWLEDIALRLKKLNFSNLLLAVVYREANTNFLDQMPKLSRHIDFSIDSIALLYSDLRITGDIVFKLYDTYGFPVDLTADVARESGFSIDMVGFEREMEAQRGRARAASRFEADHGSEAEVSEKTEFSGYERTAEDVRVIALLRDGAAVGRLEAGEIGVVVLAHTPFYAEAGGQVGDTGVLAGESARFLITDTQKQGDAHLHLGRLERGTLSIGDSLRAEVDAGRRQAIVLNHSATHLLHAALRERLGKHVTQKGSLVAPDRLRFDFSHDRPVAADELTRVEDLVNAEIRRNAPADVREMPYEEAIGAGAMALFGEKYGDTVRVMRFGGFSTELCGGTHVARTGDIGLFKIVAESGIAAGIRRIEAVTGTGALAFVRDEERRLDEIAQRIKSGRDDVVERVNQLAERARNQEKELAELRRRLAGGQGGDLTAQAVEIAGHKLLAARLDGADARALRAAVDQLKDKLGSAAIVLGAVDGDKVRLAAGVTPDLAQRLPAGELVNVAAVEVGGRGGGRADFAQAGGSEPDKLDSALAQATAWAKTRLDSL